MIAALLWKEYRTQRVAWVALALVSAASLLGLPPVMAPGGLEGHAEVAVSLRFLAGALAWTYGLVCGAMLLAGERETGTLAFLDALPGLRRSLWLAKLLSGVLLAAAQIVLLAGLAFAAGLFTDWTEAAWTFYGMVCGGLYGLAWGMLFSAYGRSVMNMILLALAAQVAAIFFTSIFSMALTALLAAFLNLPSASGEVVSNLVGGLLALLTVPAALIVSAAEFTRLDRNRMRPPPLAAPAAVNRSGRVRVAWSVLFGLAWRQTRGFALGMGLFALLLGFLVLAAGVVLWPAATLLVGVLCGATAFADEQQGPFHFLGDQRFPLGRFWLVKVGLRFLIAAAAALVIFTPSFLGGISDAMTVAQQYGGVHRPLLAHVFHSSLLETVCPGGLFLVMWLVNGFCAGCLCGLLLRSGLASGVFGLFLGVTLSAVWVPSLLGGGLHAWQALGAPALLLLSTLWLLRPWAAGRIASWTTAKRLAPFAALALLCIAGGLWYRVVEIPNVPAPCDVDSFRASLPTQEENTAGELVRSACFQFNTESRSGLDAPAPQPAPAQAQPGAPAPAPGGRAPAPVPAGAPAPAPAAAPAPRLTLFDRAGDAIRLGWKGDDPELAAWLDRLFAADWVPKLKEAVGLPPGMVEDLRNETVTSVDYAADPGRRMGVVLAARGLQRQAAGDDAAYVENLGLGLTLARALRHHGTEIDALVSRAVANTLMEGLDRWMEKLNGRPDLLRRALGLLSDYVDSADADEADQGAVNYLIARNSLNDPLPWVKDFLSGNGAGGGPWKGEDLNEEAKWVALAVLLTPWERERQDRVLRLGFSQTGPRVPGFYTGDHGPAAALPYWSRFSPRSQRELQWRSRERAMQLELALRCYQAENGRPAEKLSELFPKYLLTLPTDPYDGQTFRYRLSRGEEIAWPAEPAPAAPAAGQPGPGGFAPGQPPPVAAPNVRKIPPGQGILWSVGEDKTDDGGRRQKGSSNWTNSPGEDLIYLVPLPPE